MKVKKIKGDLLLTEEKWRHLKDHRESVQRLRFDCENFLVKNKIEDCYRQFKIKKGGRRGYRTISAPNDELKKIQRRILGRLNKVFDPRIYGAYGFVKDTSVLDNVNSHMDFKFENMFVPVLNITEKKIHNRQPKFGLNMDIKNAFDSITIGMLENFIDKYTEWSLETKEKILELCTYKGTLPQGAPTSPFLLNMVLSELDCYIINLLKKKLSP